MKIQIEELFCAAHRLATPGAGECSQLHGHTYRVRVEVSGNLYGDNGWIIDFAELRELVRDLLPDHQAILQTSDPIATLLETHNFKVLRLAHPPTAESIATYLAGKISHRLAGTGRGHLEGVTVWESPTSAATWSR